jgi:hypothetical protein
MLRAKGEKPAGQTDLQIGDAIEQCVQHTQKEVMPKSHGMANLFVFP